MSRAPSATNPCIGGWDAERLSQLGLATALAAMRGETHVIVVVNDRGGTAALTIRESKQFSEKVSQALQILRRTQSKEKRA